MSQTDIWGYLAEQIRRPEPTPPPDTHDANLARCTSKLGDVILEFLRARVGQRFHVAELTSYVVERMQCAPDSPRRVMRALCAEGRCSVALLSRRASLYFVEAA